MYQVSCFYHKMNDCCTNLPNYTTTTTTISSPPTVTVTTTISITSVTTLETTSTFSNTLSNMSNYKEDLIQKLLGKQGRAATTNTDNPNLTLMLFSRIFYWPTNWLCDVFSQVQWKTGFLHLHREYCGHQLSKVGQKSDRVAVSLTDSLHRISVQLRKVGADTGAALRKSDSYWENPSHIYSVIANFIISF